MSEEIGIDVVVEDEEYEVDARSDVLKGEKGEKGDPTATIEINKVLTGEAGTDASIDNIGTDVNMKLNITIPRGEIGTPVAYNGTFEDLKNSEIDKKYNYIILDSTDNDHEGHWVYYDWRTEEWKDGGLYLSYQLTSEIKNRLDTNESMIKQNTLGQELLNEEIVDARSGFDALGNVIKQKIYHFKNIETMKNCLTLKEGDVVQTLGYYSANDGGSATYLIREKLETDIEDLGTIHFINDTLIAELIVGKEIIPEIFGAKGDGETDDFSSINNMLLFAKKHTVKIKLKSFYLVSSPIIIDFIADIEGIYDKTGFIQSNPNNDVFIIARPSGTDIRGLSIKNFTMKWSTLPKENTCGLRIKQTGETLDSWGIHECLFERLKIYDPYIGIINESNEPSWNVDFKSIRIDRAQYQVADINAGFGINVEIIAIGNSNNTNIERGLALNANFGGTLYYDLEDWQGKVLCCSNGFFALHVKHIHLERCTFDFNYTAIITTSVTTVFFDDIEIYACNFTATNSYVYLISVYGNSPTSNACVEVKKVIQSNNTIPDTGHFVVIGTGGEIQSCYVWCVGGFPEIYFPSGTSLTRCYIRMTPVQT